MRVLFAIGERCDEFGHGARLDELEFGARMREARTRDANVGHHDIAAVPMRGGEDVAELGRAESDGEGRLHDGARIRARVARESGGNVDRDDGCRRRVHVLHHFREEALERSVESRAEDGVDDDVGRLEIVEGLGPILG